MQEYENDLSDRKNEENPLLVWSILKKNITAVPIQTKVKLRSVLWIILSMMVPYFEFLKTSEWGQKPYKEGGGEEEEEKEKEKGKTFPASIQSVIWEDAAMLFGSVQWWVGKESEETSRHCRRTRLLMYTKVI